MSKPNISGFGADSTTDEVLEGIDLSGKRALVTGASAGLGVETCRALAAHGAEVVLLARDKAKTQAVAGAIRDEVPQAKLSVEVLDLADLASVRACAAAVLENYDNIDLLINNAGVMACPLARTAEGCDMQFGVNHIGHFLLTNLLVPSLAKGQGARVVNLTSMGHKRSPVRFDDMHFDIQAYDKWVAYGQSKTANVLFAVEFSRRFAGRSIFANAVHPGGIHTELGRHLEQADIDYITASSTGEQGWSFKSVPAGAATSVWAATSPLLEGKGGQYLEDCDFSFALRPGEDLSSGYMPYAVDPQAAELLWQRSEKIVGQRFPAA
ncbi:MAG: SDR family NAD(P)-dependent oxidoreductase [Pseudomonadales bacterium]